MDNKNIFTIVDQYKKQKNKNKSTSTHKKKTIKLKYYMYRLAQNLKLMSSSFDLCESFRM